MGMVKSEKMAKVSCRSPVKGHPVMKPQGVAHSNRDVRTLDSPAKSQKYA